MKKKKWQGQRFGPESEKLHITKDDTVMVCGRTTSGKAQCCFAVCYGCYDILPPFDKRGKKRAKRSDTKECRHHPWDLKQHTNFWWCEPGRKDKGLFSWDWLQQSKGCVVCNKMFVQVGKNQLIQELPPIAPEISKLWDRLDNGLIASDKLDEVLKEAEEEEKLAKGGVSKDTQME